MDSVKSKVKPKNGKSFGHTSNSYQKTNHDKVENTGKGFSLYCLTSLISASKITLIENLSLNHITLELFTIRSSLRTLKN